MDTHPKITIFLLKFQYQTQLYLEFTIKMLTLLYLKKFEQIC